MLRISNWIKRFIHYWILSISGWNMQWSWWSPAYLINLLVSIVGPGFTRLWGCLMTMESDITRPESTASLIGLITLQMKLTE